MGADWLGQHMIAGDTSPTVPPGCTQYLTLLSDGQRLVGFVLPLWWVSMEGEALLTLPPASSQVGVSVA